MQRFTINLNGKQTFDVEIDQDLEVFQHDLQTATAEDAFELPIVGSDSTVWIRPALLGFWEIQPIRTPALAGT